MIPIHQLSKAEIKVLKLLEGFSSLWYQVDQCPDPIPRNQPEQNQGNQSNQQNNSPSPSMSSLSAQEDLISNFTLQEQSNPKKQIKTLKNNYIIEDSNQGSRKYQCGKCKKIFNNHQSLGQHQQPRNKAPLTRNKESDRCHHRSDQRHNESDQCHNKSDQIIQESHPNSIENLFQ
ncbi:unnamed protein product [Paramecium octaurelia]|uniref:C2H2-type domain-containing protein n=1 Tax=Paramecium octaurelia TaxID=43137 RepID=A0A8S1S3E5_PAROT|nr:unnamed protein product [Paramecium octaurelia]